ncbi:hypothetical protein F2Q69_00016097 [Brassica cretica]|uniref:Uncharacterized protein n=1 Tax=Brassica cretica TaxID=69181 RepID=A0A8S9R3H0_BRACR|nr:hypothetical protein F2Q69_00016097 [Brassica cretica]
MKQINMRNVFTVDLTQVFGFKEELVGEIVMIPKMVELGSSSDMRVVPPSKMEFPPYDGTPNAIEWSFHLMMTIFMIKECSMTMQKYDKLHLY